VELSDTGCRLTGVLQQDHHKLSGASAVRIFLHTNGRLAVAQIKTTLTQVVHRSPSDGRAMLRGGCLSTMAHRCSAHGTLWSDSREATLSTQHEDHRLRHKHEAGAEAQDTPGADALVEIRDSVVPWDPDEPIVREDEHYENLSEPDLFASEQTIDPRLLPPDR
jgi:hypothetical protein